MIKLISVAGAQENLTGLAESYINGNKNYVREQVRKLSKTKTIELIEVLVSEYGQDRKLITQSLLN